MSARCNLVARYLRKTAHTFATPSSSFVFLSNLSISPFLSRSPAYPQRLCLLSSFIESPTRLSNGAARVMNSLLSLLYFIVSLSVLYVTLYALIHR